jgi:5-formyltetrahydrofolate cyclo-ligase
VTLINSTSIPSPASPADARAAALAAARKPTRAALRARRRAVPPVERARIAKLVARHIGRNFHLRSGARVALYASLPEELDTSAVIALARSRRWKIYLPRIDHRRRGRGMQFVLMGSRHRTNRLGILEPHGSLTLPARRLDLVFLPILGFDVHGVRLGTGGGYYDRAFAFRRWRTAWTSPRLIGIAYSFQQVQNITPAAHDVLLDAVVTEQGIIQCVTG